MSNDVENNICVFTFILFSEVIKTYNKQCYVKCVKMCNAILTQLKVYVICNVLALCLACKLYNHNIMVWHSEVPSGENSICVCHLPQKCIKKKS